MRRDTRHGAPLTPTPIPACDNRGNLQGDPDMPSMDTTRPPARRPRAGPARLLATLAVAGLLAASCGTNSGKAGPSGAVEAASQAPAISPAASVGGTLT